MPCMYFPRFSNAFFGALGAALLARVQQLGWARRLPGSRVLAFSADGEAALRAWLA